MDGAAGEEAGGRDHGPEERAREGALERAYEEAMEQLQADLDALEQVNAKLKTLANNPERQASTAQFVEAEAVPTEGNLETSHLLEQVRDCPDWRIVIVLTSLSSSRSMHFVGLSHSSARKTRFSRARTSSRRSRRCPSCLHPFPAHQHHRSYPRRSQIRTRTPRTSPGRLQRCARSQSSRNSSIARSSSTLRPRALSTSPCSRRRARTGSR